MQSGKETLLVVLFVVVGIIFRLWLTHVSPQSFAFDQGEYESYAIKITNDSHFLASYSFRPYVYPMFLSLVYKYGGFGNHEPIFVLQAIIDSIVGVFMYIILRQISNKNSFSLIAMLLYELNPFTAAYVGVILSEILTLFLITASFVAGLFYVKKPTHLYGFLFGILIAFAAQARVAVFPWLVIPVGFTIWSRAWKEYVPTMMSLLLGIILPILYPLYVNWRDFHEITPTTVDNIMVKELYIGTVMDRPKPFSADFPGDIIVMYRDYYTEMNLDRSAQERRAIVKKYLDKSIENVRRDPLRYLRRVATNMLFLWHTDAIFPYQEPGYRDHRFFTYWGNAFLLFIAVIGIIGLGFVHTPSVRWFWRSILGTFLYATVTMSFTLAEHRLVIPFYPLLFICAGVALQWIAQEMQKNTHTSQ